MRTVCERDPDSLLRARRQPWSGLISAVILGGLTLTALPTALSASEQSTADPGTIARQTVATALGLDLSAAQVISTEPLDFSDASLDCPEPGAAYAQVITPGFRILVEANGRRFDVRVAGTGGRICYRRKPSAGPQSDGGIGPRELGEAARQDLALRLGVLPETITVTGLHRLKSGETLAGCGEVCALDEPPSSCGLGVRLRVAGQDGEQDFDYVARPTGVTPCPGIASQ